MTSVDRLIVLGAGGHAKVVIETAKATGAFSRIEVLDDNPNISHVLDAEVVGRCADAVKISDTKTVFFVAIGNNQVRCEWIAKLKQAGQRLHTLVHPAATISPTVSIGIATLVVAGAIINADTTVGEGCIVNTGATVDHDCSLAVGVHIAPGVNLCGGVKVGEQVLIGVGSAVLPGVRIGNGCIVGGGATVCSDIQDGATVVGSPAKSKMQD